MAIAVACECGRRFEAFDSDAGGLAECPACGRAVAVPKGAARSDVLLIGDEAPRTSRKAVASLVLGVCFFFACLSGIPAILCGVDALRDIRASRGRLKGRMVAGAGIVLGVVGCLFTITMATAYCSAREAAKRGQCVNNFKQIGLALYNYHDVYGCLPPAAICDPEGRPLLSWRVAILPFMEQTALYQKLRLDEPWDSPHNRALLDSMPSEYRCLSDATLQRGMTDYQVVVGPGTAFAPDFRPVRFKDFADGTASTLLVGESRHSVPWTKPENLAFEMDPPFAGLGGHHGYHVNGFNALFGDGSVRFLRATVPAKVLGALLTRSGHEAITADQY